MLPIFRSGRALSKNSQRDNRTQIGPRKPLKFKPRLEALENRDLPTTLIELDFNGMTSQDAHYIVNHHISTTVTTGPQPSWINFSILNTQFGGFETFKF